MSEYSVKLRSNYLNGTIDLRIIMPNPLLAFNPKPFYESGEKFPVLWLLHGGCETWPDWITYTSVSKQAIYKNTIIVEPLVPNSDFINQPMVGEGYPFYDFFFLELMPFIHNWFPASKEPENNFIAGYSMGAEAVWRYGLSKPEAFGGIAPINYVPSDYSFLEEYRDMTCLDFVKLAKGGQLPSAYAEGSMTAREINNFTKYETVGDFLDSIENTMARFKENVEAGNLPKIYLPGLVGNEKLKGFEKQADDIGAETITFAWTDNTVPEMDFIEEALISFMDYVGLENIEDPSKGKPPHMPGVHEFPEGTPGRTAH